MSRPAKPWRRGGGPWYAWVRGTAVWLAPKEATMTRARAELAHVLAGGGGERRDRMTLADLVEDYGADLERRAKLKELKPRTVESYREILLPFSRALGRTEIQSLRPHQLTTWLASTAWGPTRQRYAGAVLKAAIRWGRRAGHHDSDPLRDWSPPKARRRETAASRDQVRKLLDVCLHWTHREFIEILAETGCRPSEVAAVTASMVDAAGKRWVLPEHKTRRTSGKARVVYLSDRATELSVSAAARHAVGPIFRSSSGEPWTKNGWGKLVGRVRKRAGLPKGITAYAMRHGYATAALQTQPPAIVAALLGHSSVATLRHYDHTSDLAAELSRAAATIASGQAQDASEETGSDQSPLA
jgi:integrase